MLKYDFFYSFFLFPFYGIKDDSILFPNMLVDGRSFLNLNSGIKLEYRKNNYILW